MANILFVCMANRYRSPIAEACFKAEVIKREQDQTWHISSAGTWTKDDLPAMPDALIQAEKIGLDIQNHRSRVVTDEILNEADLIFVMENGQKEALSSEYPQVKNKIYLLTEATLGIPYNIPDPVEHKDENNVPIEICDLIQKNYDKMIALLSKTTRRPLG